MVDQEFVLGVQSVLNKISTVTYGDKKSFKKFFKQSVKDAAKSLGESRHVVRGAMRELAKNREVPRHVAKRLKLESSQACA